MNNLLEAAKEVINIYVTALEQDCHADLELYIKALCQAVNEAEIMPEYNCSLCVPDNCACAMLDKFVEYDPHKPELYKPMTDDEWQTHYNETPDRIFNDIWFYERLIERAVIERLGLVWGGQ